MARMFSMMGAVLCLILMASVSHAQRDDLVLNLDEPMTVRASTTKGPFYDESKAEKRARKLVRGLGNMLFGVAEIPNQMFKRAYETSPVTGSVVGFFVGIGKGVQRMGYGLVETVTFFDDGNNNFEPMLYPEQVFMDSMH